MALSRELWIKQIREALNDNNDFNRFSVNHSSFVNRGTVHVPNAGSPSDVVRNRTTIPATASNRTDSDLTYDIDHFTTDPIQLGFYKLEDIELSYDKLKSVMSQDMAKLKDTINDWLIYKWAVDAASPSSEKIVESSGPIDFSHLLDLAEIMDRDQIPRSNRKLLVNPEIARDLLDIDRLSKTESLNNQVSVDGFIGRLAGFDIIERGRVVETDVGTGDIVDPTLSGQPTAVAWHPGFVSKAYGEIEVFERTEDPLVYGSIVSFGVRAGGSHMRTDFKGVYSLVKDNS